MKIERAKHLIESLESIKSAEFYEPAAHFIAFKTNFTNLIGTRGIRTYPFNKITAKFINELNEAIKPVLEKYIKIYEDEIKKCLDQ